MNGRILSFLATLSLGLSVGCNLADDEAGVVLNNQVEQNNATNGGTNNTTNTATNNATNVGNNTTNDGPATVTFADKLINGSDAEAASVVASSAFDVTATVTTKNSSTCAGCPVQVVLENGAGLTCLTDGPAGTETKTVPMMAPDLTGDMFIYYHLMEEATCDAAIEKVSESTKLFAKVTVVDGLTLLDVSPNQDAKNVAVDATITITASKLIDADTATNSVLLLKNGVPVSTSTVVEGAVITLTPTAPLDEFQTEYSVVVTTGLKSVNGLTLGQEKTASFQTTTLAADTQYSIRNAYHGQNYDLVVGTTNVCQFASNGTADTQSDWQAARFPQGGTYLHATARGVGFALDGGDGSNGCSLTQTVGGNGQSWQFVKSGGGFLMQTKAQGVNRALDGTKAPPQTAQPLMADVNGESNQLWFFVRN